MGMDRNKRVKLLLPGAILMLSGLLFASVERALDDGYVALLLTGLALATAASFMLPRNGNARRFSRG